MKRILFVDDENRILDGIRRMLYSDRNRWQLDFALGAEAALSAMETAKFDVIVSDMRMPGIDGAQLLAEVKERAPATVRIILSGHTEMEAAARAVPMAHRFLAKPCNAAVLRETLERSCALQDLLDSAELREVVCGLGELPTVSRTYVALTDALANPETAIEDVAKIVGSDVAMSARLLQLANNAFFGVPREVHSVLGATSHLGIDTIKKLVLTAEVFQAFPPNPHISAAFWAGIQDHAIKTTAIAAKFQMNKVDKEASMVAALLHDVGKLVLASRRPQQFVALLATAKERKCKTWIVEEEVLGVSHAEIGAYLLGLWGLPHAVVEAVAYHHHPGRILHTGFDVGAALFLANLLADLPADEEGDPIERLTEADRSALGALGLSARFGELSRVANA